MQCSPGVGHHRLGGGGPLWPHGIILTQPSGARREQSCITAGTQNNPVLTLFLSIFFVLFKTSSIRAPFCRPLARKNGLADSVSWSVFHSRGNCYRVWWNILTYKLRVWKKVDWTFNSFRVVCYPEIGRYLKVNKSNTASATTALLTSDIRHSCRTQLCMLK